MQPSRAYNLVLTDRTFNNRTHCYVLVGLEISTKHWTLLGGKVDNNETLQVAAARELYEESCATIDKRNDTVYWVNLPFYEFGGHRVYVHRPGSIDVNINNLNNAATNIQKSNKPHDFKEMSRYQLVRLTDFANLRDKIYNHPTEKESMEFDGYIIYTLTRANLSVLDPYKY
jgi:hypothetical protein